MNKGNFDNDFDEISDVVVYDIVLSEDEYELLLEDEELCDEFLDEVMELF
ncbi:MAG: hypothetical protein IJH63_03265 [Methanobrevibacter sp.]|nr:hypothetical protein [Methanobrevibacter sp.]